MASIFSGILKWGRAPQRRLDVQVHANSPALLLNEKLPNPASFVELNKCPTSSGDFVFHIFQRHEGYPSKGIWSYNPRNPSTCHVVVVLTVHLTSTAPRATRTGIGDKRKLTKTQTHNAYSRQKARGITTYLVTNPSQLEGQLKVLLTTRLAFSRCTDIKQEAHRPVAYSYRLPPDSWLILY